MVALADRVDYQPAERETWSQDGVRAFLRTIAGDRLAAAWRLSLYGLRRGEVCRLRWCDVDLKGGTLEVVQTRVLCDGEVIIEEPKSRNGNRTLPLDDELTAALKALRKQQAAESEAAGEAYDGGEYVAADELGTPVPPEWYSDEWERIIKPAGLRRIRLHDGRHSCLSLMEKAGVPISVISRWAGHFDSSFTYSVYVHASDDDLKAGSDALAEIYKIA